MSRPILATLALAVSALVALLPLTVSAHGPTRQKVTQTIEINAPADKVWAVIGKFQDMGWHPAVGKTEGSGDNAPGAKRTLTLKAGGTIAEELTKYNATDKTFSYEIKDVEVKVVPVTNYSSTISVKGDGAKSTVEWKGAFYRGYVNNDPPAELSDEAAINAVTGIYKSGLDGLKAKLEAGG
jgi:carbon monoxide dehydrogenase subunit G